jgi:hypothetical protein
MLVAWLKPAGALLVVAFEAALLLVDFFPASGVPHEPEAACAVEKTGRQGDGEMGRWGDGEMGRWGDGSEAPSLTVL